MNVGRLKGIIVERGLSQRYLSEKLNLSNQSLNAKCNGRSVFRLNEIQDLSRELNLSAKEVWEIFFADGIS